MSTAHASRPSPTRCPAVHTPRDPSPSSVLLPPPRPHLSAFPSATSSRATPRSLLLYRPTLPSAPTPLPARVTAPPHAAPPSLRDKELQPPARPFPPRIDRPRALETLAPLPQPLDACGMVMARKPSIAAVPTRPSPSTARIRSPQPQSRNPRAPGLFSTIRHHHQEERAEGGKEETRSLKGCRPKLKSQGSHQRKEDHCREHSAAVAVGASPPSLCRYVYIVIATHPAPPRLDSIDPPPHRDPRLRAQPVSAAAAHLHLLVAAGVSHGLPMDPP
jgi:hypothetical protein